MTEYTPTTKSVRKACILGHYPLPTVPQEKQLGAEFDRWLETIRAEAKAEALLEAVDDFESNVGAGEFTEQSRDGETYWRHAAEAWEHQGPYMQWLRNRANQIKAATK